MKRKLWKEIIVAVLLVSTILSFSPIAYGEITSVQQSIDSIKMEMKQAALAYVDPALKGELVPSSSLDSVLNSVKKNYQETKKIILASNLSEKDKQSKLKELEALYQEKIVKGLIPYIDAYNYATKYLDPLLKEIKEAEAKNDFLAVEKAYHKLSVQLKSRTSILYRFTGKAPRDLLLAKYKKPADNKRDEMMVPVTIIMKLTNAEQLYLAGKKEEAIKAIEDIPSLVAKLSSTNTFHQALIKELERLQAIFFSAPIAPIVPAPPVSGGSGGSSETPAESALRLAKTKAINELTIFKVDVKDDYSTTNWEQISTLKTAGLKAINSAKTTIEVTQALADAKAEILLIEIKSSLSTIREITVKGVVAVVSTADTITYSVELPAGTDLANLKATDIKVTAADLKSVIAHATTDNGGITWKVVVTSENGKSITTYTINVTVNNAPSVANEVPDQNGTVGNAVTVNLSNVFADADNDPLTITADKGTVTGTTWSYTPVPGDAGTTITVTVTANDGKGGTAQDTFTVLVKNPYNKAPIVLTGHTASSSALGHTFSYHLDYLVTFYDPDGDTLTISVTSSDTSILEVSLNNNTVHIKTISVGSAKLTFTANDGRGGTVSHTADAYVFSAP